MSENELQHYGVLGMKWGVRRGNVDKAYSKASKKLKKIDDKVNKRTNDYHKKAEKAQDYATRTFASPTKRAKTHQKAKKAARKLTQVNIKGKKWVAAMEKSFKGTTAQLSKEQIELGRQYTNFLTERYNSRY